MSATTPANPLPCPVCGGPEFEWGTVAAHGLNFRPDAGSWLFRQLRFGFTLPARRCRGCGHLQLFAGPTPLAGRVPGG